MSVICVGDFNVHVCRHIDGCNGMAEEFERKNVICFVWRRNYVCQIHGLRERKRGR